MNFKFALKKSKLISRAFVILVYFEKILITNMAGQDTITFLFLIKVNL